MTTNNVATFNGCKIIVKIDENHKINTGDKFTILTSDKKTADDTYVVEFQGANIPMSYQEESFQTGTSIDSETNAEVPVYGYKLIVTAGTGTGVFKTSLDDSVSVFAIGGQIFVEGSNIQSVTVLNLQGQIITTSSESIIPVNATKGVYLVKVKTASGIVIKKVIL